MAEMEGSVALVGAGPGDPGLITVRGLECLERADVVVYDRLAPRALLDRVRPEAERIYVGKGPGSHAMSQDDINRTLVERARAGLRVVRLKGGDPFVFGRGGEEALALAAAGVPFEIVPGVTSAIAAPSSAGIPVTHRGVASSFAVVTGHEQPNKDGSAIRWRELAGAADTLVFLMGVEHLKAIVQNLLDAGRRPAEPAAMVQWGTTPRQRVVVGTLADIAERVERADIRPPGILVVGGVVALRESLAWRERLPLAGLRVLVTRAREQASELSARLRDLGAWAWEFPTIRIEPVEDPAPLDRALGRLGEFDWIILTSANGVEAVFARLDLLGLDARALAGVRVCAIGPATSAALTRRGIRADWVPERYVSSAIVDGFRDLDPQGIRVLMPRADIAPPDLAEGLRALGAQVDEVHAYRTTVDLGHRDELIAALRAGEIDVATFTSSSTVRNLVAGLDGRADLLADVAVACIGPVTARTARELGIRVDVESAVHTLEGLVASIVEWQRGRARAGPRQASL